MSMALGNLGTLRIHAVSQSSYASLMFWVYSIYSVITFLSTLKLTVKATHLAQKYGNVCCKKPISSSFMKSNSVEKCRLDGAVIETRGWDSG